MSTTHDSLIKAAKKWLRNTANCGAVVSELVANTTYGEQPDAIGFRHGGVSIMIECKVSINDFKKDFKKPFRKDPSKGVGLYRFYMCPEGLITIDMLPERWGLLYVSNRNTVKRIHGGPAGNMWHVNPANCFAERNFQAEWEILYSALRRKQEK